MTIKVKLDEGAYMPDRAHGPDAGADLFSPVEAIVYPGCNTTINTGVHMAIPFGYAGEIMSKSGPLRYSGIFTTGLVDSGYTGPIGVTLHNSGNDPYMIKKGQKIAQIVIKKSGAVRF